MNTGTESPSVEFPLQSNPLNPRVITPERLSSLDVSMKKFGDLGGIIYNVRTQRLVGGHQRVETLSGANPAPVITASPVTSPDGCGTKAVGFIEANGTRYSYREVDWDEQTEGLAMIAANAQGGEFTDDGLAALLTKLKEGNADMMLTGISAKEINAMLATSGPGASAPAGRKGRKVDRVHLDAETRAVLDECKALLKETDDGLTIQRIAKSFLA